MARVPWLSATSLALALAGCGGSGPAGAQTSLNTRTVTLPDGFEVATELKVTPEDMARGMMYRDKLAGGRGMLFIHSQPGRNPYWMANCIIPLDIIWMDSDHKVVEISPSTPPCPAGGNSCPTYGGNAVSQYVLELGGGEAAKHQVRDGSLVRF